MESKGNLQHLSVGTGVDKYYGVFMYIVASIVYPAKVRNSLKLRLLRCEPATVECEAQLVTSFRIRGLRVCSLIGWRAPPQDIDG